ncbi:COG3904 family protein [Mesorhizobium silamurunense]|uniref:COG3904 family protein n=1 Tax=Mesorhizobium silamurunense TaxID=499528 RepID=UPI0017807169
MGCTRGGFAGLVRRSDSIRWWRGLFRLGLAAVIGLASFVVEAKDEAPDLGPTMRFAVVRSSATGCEPNCPEWISAEGIIEAGTPALFRRLLKTLGGRQLPIVVNSPGGNVDAALQLGRMIRKANLDIAVGTTELAGCSPEMKTCRDNDSKNTPHAGVAYDSGAMCNSACPLMFAGGVRRLVGEWAFLGVHQITTTYHREKLLYRTTYKIVNGKKKVLSTRIVSRKNAGSYKTYEMSKAVEKRLTGYLKEMGVGQGVLDVMKATPASDIRQIEPDDMLEMKLVTSLDSLDLLTEATICRRDPVPTNCREIPANGKAKPAEVAMVATEPTLSQPTEAASSPRQEREMRFVLVRGSNPLCNPDCPEWIAAEGTIVAATPDRLRELLDTVGGRRLPVVVNSPGGDIQGALATGRLIRERRLDVAVARTDFLDCDPGAAGCVAKDGFHSGLTVEAGAECDAACAVMIAGGARRFVGADAHFLVHSMGMEDKVRAYLEEMAIGAGLFVAMQSAQFAKHRELSQDELAEFGLTTGRQSVDALTGATICKLSPKPGNCRVLPSANAEAESPAKL